MDDKLEALADVIEEWPEEVRVNVTLHDGGRVVAFDWNTDGEDGKADWLDARARKFSSPEDEAFQELDRKLNGGGRSKYHVEIRPGVWVDVYDVLMAYRITNPADAHAIKKMLCPGRRGVKSANQDRREAIQSLERAIELEGGRDHT